MANSFDPDAYLAQKAPTASQGFDPDAYLAQKAPAWKKTVSGIARPALETVGMLGGAALAGAGSLPSGPVAIPAAAAGGALGYAGGKSAADMLDRSLGIKNPIAGVAQAAKETAGNVAEGVGLEMAGAIPGPALKALNPVAKKAMGFMAEKFGGLANDTIKVLEENAPAVVKYARQGVEAASEAAASAAKSVKSSIDKYVDSAGEAYRVALDKVVSQNPQYNAIRVNLKRVAGDTVESLRQDFGFPSPSAGDRLSNIKLLDSSGQPVQSAQGAIRRVGKPASDVELFNDFAGQFQDGLTPTQAYLLQKDLSYAIRSNAGKPIAAALGKLKSAAIEAFDGAIGSTPLADINRNYRFVMNLAEDLSKVSNADNAVQVINTAFRNRGETRDALLAISRESPEAGAAINEMFAATAGKNVAHWTAQLPPTGLKALHQAGLVGSAAMVGHNPVVGLPVMAGYFAGTSPRLYGEGFNLLSKSLPAMPARSGSVAALAALRSQRQK